MREPTDWPFDDPKNLACYTTMDVLDGRKPIGLVTHDADDGSWQFLPFEGVGDDDADVSWGRLVGLEEITKLDPSILELSDLPLGWIAFRSSPDLPWVREVRPEEDTD
jgi:hypothetical protein